MKQKILPLLLALLTAYLPASAYDFMVDDMCYNINSDGTSVTVTYEIAWSYQNYSNLSGDIIIPPSVTNDGTDYSVTSIGDKAFMQCNGLTSITIPNSVTTIGSTAFEYCYGLTSATIPNSVTSIGYEAFDQCGLTSITIPNSVTYIGYSAFTRCPSLESIVVEEGNTKYDSRNNCNAIIETESNTLLAGCKNTIIPNTVTSIGESAFQFCYDLTSVTIPSSVIYIGSEAFEGCTNLTSITIPNSVALIGEMAFTGCSSLESISVEGGNAKYDSRDNCNALIETESNKLLAGCKNTIIPNTVTSIGTFAFEDTGLTSISIPNSVTSIGHYAFFDCMRLTSVDIPNSVTFIGDRAFYYCWRLRDLYSYIENPSSVSLGSDIFLDVPTSTCVLHVPAGTTELYRAADQWNAFINIEEIMTGIDNITTDHKSDGIYYNLMGQPVKNPTTGIYIYNGKKVIVR